MVINKVAALIQMIIGPVGLRFAMVEARVLE